MWSHSNTDYSCVERRRRRLAGVGRRQLLALLLGTVAAPGAAISAWPHLPVRARRVVVVNGWVLLEDDLLKAVDHVA
jgi:hypothetical protein